MLTTKKKAFPLNKVYQLLEPGPVVLVTTSRNGKPNIMTMSWLTMMDFEPPLVGCIVSNRNFSFNTLRRTKECVLNIPTEKLAAKVIGCGNTSGQDTEKFKHFKLTPTRAAKVQAPLIEECFASLECKVVDSKMANKYNLFILEVIKAWMRPSKKPAKTLHHLGDGCFMIAGKIIKLPSKMK